MQYQLGIIGAGNMAEAIARGVVNARLFTPDQMIASDVSASRRAIFSGIGVATVEPNADAARQCNLLLLSVKPQQMSDALASIAPVLSEQTLIVSIAAGISSTFIEQRLGAGKTWRIVRAMPNTPMLVGEGMVGLARGRHASDEDVRRARQVFESAARVIEVAEEKIDAVTAMSGSGPAYFFYLVEQMIEAGVAMGLSPEQSRELATRTAMGAAKMLATSTDTPSELRKKVTSPGGTTQAAITYLEGHKVGQSIIEAIWAAERRGKELGQ